MPFEYSYDARTFFPPRRTLSSLKSAAAACQACPLWKTGTQTVFGAGPAKAFIVLVGEVPGNDEDLAGKPFVGPAGKLLDKALEAAGIDRREVYLTNAVKHFKWEPRGKKRLHKKPSAREIGACHPWLEAELQAIRPRVLICLGATAAQTLLGRDFRVTLQRGQWIPSPHAEHVMATIHPSSILRAPDDAARHAEMDHFIADLRKIKAVPLG